MASHLRCFVLAILLSFAVVANASDVAFPKKKVVVGGKTLTVEVATTVEQQAQGLMSRAHLGPDEGMLFVFSNEETRFFWMKNTLIDLSIGFFNKDGKLIDIQEMKSGKGLADTALPSYASSNPAKYALEMNKGWFEKNKIKVGAKLKINP
ncbi:DUF192 domain-containing protein [Bdellovibrio sp. HCB288]|uniref:DUF192 domain-containing protein n=1 Tax=Bdellovibrio sp. HCB288 TaxID=3394355 RepID=UPI0039B6DACD